MKLEKGSLLLASPLLLDPHFYQSVVFVMNHDASGCFGLILNRPHSFTLGEGLGSACPDSLKKHSLYSGGPVQPQSFFCLHNNGTQEKDGRVVYGQGTGNFKEAQEIIPGVYIGAENSVLDAYAFDNPGTDFKACFFSGYSGWGANQLEQEIEEGSWIIHESNSSLIFRRDNPNLWEYLMTKSSRPLTQRQSWDSSKYN